MTHKNMAVLREKNDGVMVGVEIPKTGEALEAVGLKDAKVHEIVAALRMKHYILDDKMVPVLHSDEETSEWRAFMEKFARLRHTRIGKYEVSTIFFGVDAFLVGNGYEGRGREPELFATILHGDSKGVFTYKTSRTVEEAALKHKLAIIAIKGHQTRWPWEVISDRIKNGCWE